MYRCEEHALKLRYRSVTKNNCMLMTDGKLLQELIEILRAIIFRPHFFKHIHSPDIL